MSSGTNQNDRKELLKAALRRIDELESQLASRDRRAAEPLAVVGLACRFPNGANDPEKFWALLRNGIDGVGRIPASRWDADAYFDPDPDAPGKTYARDGGFIDDVDLFDADLFGIAPREAIYMDPQQRILLEVVWEALERGGIAASQLSATSTGVFVGMTTSDYSHLQWEGGTSRIVDAYFGSGVAPSVAAGRLAYTFGLRGPCVTVDTACSSSLVALHLAAQSLRTGECRMAIVGGVNLMLSPGGHVVAAKGRMLSPTGRCRTFDAAADGYVRSEGCGIVVLKRLSDADADGDRVLALVRGTAINQDGRSSGLTAPNGRAQEDVMRQALASAGLGPQQLSYVETHGTGTSLGDPIEVQALGSVHGPGRSTEDPLLIGSVKSNIGHLEAAAGIAGFIKIVLALQHGELPPNLHFRQPNPHIPWAQLPISVVAASMPWQPREGRRIAGLSSFGFSGTNAHVIAEEAPQIAARTLERPERPAHVLALSARTEAGLKKLVGRYVEALAADDSLAFPDVCFTASTGRSHLETRLAVVAESRKDAVERLESFLADPGFRGVATGQAAKRAPQPVFVFTGQGSQYVDMGRTLFDTEPVFRAAVSACDEIVRARLGRSLLPVLYPEGSGAAEGETLLRRTEYAQPALFAIEWGLASLWRSWGIEPAAVFGHSVGEYVAACVAGVFSLEDGVTLIAERGRLMQALPEGGTMAAVFAAVDLVRPALAGLESAVSIAAVNGPENVVISGSAAGVDSALGRLAGRGIRSKPLEVSHAFHSPLLEPALDALQQAAARVRFSAPRTDLVSNLTGTMARLDQVSDPKYWREHARKPVLFADGLAALRAQGHHVFVEIGPHPVLMGMAAAASRGDLRETWVTSLRRGQDDWREVLTALATLYTRGVEVDWARFDEGRGRRRTLVPTYPFQRERFWFDMRPGALASVHSAADVHPLLGHRLRSRQIEGSVFEAHFAPDAPSFLADHQIHGLTIVPGAVYLEMMAAAAQQVFGGAAHRVDQFAIREALTLDPEGCIVQTIVGAVDGNAASVEICSAPVGEPSAPWTVHASGRISATGEAESAEPTGFEEPAPDAADTRTWQPDEYYARLRAVGAAYGPTFRGLRSITASPAGAEGTVAADDVLQPDLTRYRLHPALLDAAFQLVGAAISGTAGTGADLVFVPLGADSYVVRRHPAGPLQVRVRSVGTGSETLVCDLRIRDAGGVVADVRGLRFKRADPASLKRRSYSDVRPWIHTIEWEPVATAPAARIDADAAWLVLADRQGVAEGAVAAIGGSAIVAHADAGTSPEAVRALVERASSGRRLLGVVHGWNLDLPDDPASSAELSQVEDAGCLSALFVAQAVAEGSSGATLTIVTCGAQHVGGDTRVAASQAPVCGLGRVLASELPALRTRLIDLDPDGSREASIAGLAAELSSEPGVENQIALRGNRRLAPRLVNAGVNVQPRSLLKTPAEGPMALDIVERGVLDRLHCVPFDPDPPGSGQVQIRVEASGLNFRDVLNALGMYPGDPGPFGGEVVGVVEALGAGVTDLEVGDPVLALTPRGFCTRVNTSSLLAWRRPRELAALDAATIPLVFHTAQYALTHVAGMKAGDRVLIHSAAGGVGLAAVQLAQRAGAEILATAGSPEKRALLRALGVRHVMSSRTLEFAEAFKAATGGAGVDIVLNSLAGEFITQSLKLLRPGGWFLELGKTDLWTAERAAGVAPGVRYQPVYLGTICEEDPQRIRTMFGELMPAFAAGELRPLPHVVFPIDRAADAFRFMAQARHVGKIVISQRLSGPASALRADATYLVTGAFGALGERVAKGLIERGARRLMLVGRHASAGVTERLRCAGASVDLHVHELDVADRHALDAAIRASCTPDAPLRGVVHAAGVLDDGAVTQQTAERFARVMRPKLHGAWNLHDLTRERDLDFFVVFSAGAALFGSAGQSNYAAANAYLDALAHQRRAKGLPALSVNWGPWDGGGMAASVSARDRERWAAQGLGQIDPDRGVAALELLVGADIGQAAVLPIHWPTFLAAARAAGGAPILAGLERRMAERHVEQTRAAEAVVSFAQQLEKTAPEDRRAALAKHVTEQVARVLGLRSDAALRSDRGFSELGMDSLMSVELSNRFKESLGRPIQTTLAFEHPTIAAVTDHLGWLLGIGAEAVEETKAAVESGERESLLADVERLSEDEAEATLARELDRAGY
jgi:acyl transferase domain-containing protein/NADPH-dependent curcumin reductase CurA/nucleoside-diphosphate-sugar epimerase/acyl carrier protein